MTFTLRSMALQDVDRVLLLAKGSAEAPDWTRSEYEKAMQSGGAEPLFRYAVVAIAGTTLVGFAVAAWLRLEAAAEIENIVVDPAYRLQGVGRGLLRACMAWAAEAGAAAVRLEVRASNAAALALYASQGFAQQGLRPAYYQAPVEDALLLVALLPSQTLP